MKKKDAYILLTFVLLPLSASVNAQQKNNPPPEPNNSVKSLFELLRTPAVNNEQFGIVVTDEHQKQTLLQSVNTAAHEHYAISYSVTLKKRKRAADQYFTLVFNNGKSECSDTFNLNHVELLSLLRIDTLKKTIETVALLKNPFKDIDLLTGELSPDYDENMFAMDSCDQIAGYDFAPFVISKSDTAFGINTGHNEMYAAGSAYSAMVHLFTKRGSALHRIASILVYNSSDLAGEWAEDGTRGHVENEIKWIVKIGSRGADGYNDLIIKETTATTKKETKLTWNTETEQYEK